jgi:hypothetical protein
MYIYFFPRITMSNIFDDGTGAESAPTDDTPETPAAPDVEDAPEADAPSDTEGAAA